jgi:hypothetical protein
MPQLCACVYAVLVRCCSSFVTVSVGTCRQSVTDDRSAVAVRASCQPVHCRCDRRSVGPILSTGLGASIPWSSIACVAGCILSCHQSLKGTSVVKYVESFYSPPSCFFFFSQDRVYLAACIKKKIHQHACAFSCISPLALGSDCMCTRPDPMKCWQVEFKPNPLGYFGLQYQAETRERQRQGSSEDGSSSILTILTLSAAVASIFHLV